MFWLLNCDSFQNEEITAALAAVVTEADRIPPIPVIEEPTAVVGDAEDPLEVRRKQIRENIRKEKERSVWCLFSITTQVELRTLWQYLFGQGMLGRYPFTNTVLRKWRRHRFA